MIIFGNCPSGMWSFIVKHNAANTQLAMVRPTTVIELNYDWLNCFALTRGSGLGHPDSVIAKCSILPEPGAG